MQTEMYQEILTPIDSIVLAKDHIVTPARKHITSLDWANFGISMEQSRKDFELLFPFSLRMANLNFPLNVLTRDIPRDSNLIDQIQPKNIAPLSNDTVFLALLRNLDPTMANFIKAHLILKVPELIAASNDKDAHNVVTHFVSKHPDLYTPLLRTYYSCAAKLGITLK